jgi:hypothetical protein
MPTTLAEGFSIGSASPVDDRIVVANVTEFNAIPSIGGRSYLGMLVFFTDSQQLFFVSELNGGSPPTLTEFSGGSTSLSALGLDGDLTTFSVPADTTITNFGRTLLANFTAGQVKTDLGLTIGTDVQAFNQNLADIAGLATTNNHFIVGNGSSFTLENASTARSSLGVDAAGTDNSTDVTLATVTGNYLTINSSQQITAGTVPITLGGTGATDASTARTNLGITYANIGTTATTFTSIRNNNLVIGGNSQNNIIKFDTDDEINLQIDNSTKLQVESTGINVTGDITASNADFSGTVDANTFTVNGIDFTVASTTQVSGSTAFGTVASGSDPGSTGTSFFPSDITHQFTGSVLITGSLSLPGIANVSESIKSLKTSVDAGSPFTSAGISGSFNGQTGSFVTNSDTASFVTNSDTASFVTNSDTASFVTNSDTASFVTNSDTASFVTNSDTASFVTNSDTASFVTNSDTASFVTTTEFTFNSIVVSNINDTYDVSTFSDPNTPQSFEVRDNNGNLWDESTFMLNSSVTASTIDKDLTTVASYNLSGVRNNSFNLIWDFETPTIVSEFRHSFDKDSSDTLFALPYQVFIYGKNTEFDISTDITDGVLLGEGARPGLGGKPAPGAGPVIWGGPSFNPVSIFSIGDENNLSRTSSIRETSLTSSFRYYRIRYEGTVNSSIGAQFASENNTEINLKEVTPITRSFVDNGTSISASNGVLNVSQIITNNLIGTSSFAVLAGSAVSASHALTASYVENVTTTIKDPTINDAVINGLTANGNIVISGSLIITSSTDEVPHTGDLTVAGNLSVGTITDVEQALINAPSLQDVDVNFLPNTTNTFSIGNSSFKWKSIFARDTFFGGIHEINLETEGLNKMQEGTVLSLKNGTMCPCENEADPLVMGIVSKGENYPIVLGAEPVLVTGKIKEGDYIITSNIKGHGKGISPQYIYSQQLFGKIIAQALEDGEGESYIIKAMIRKM